MAVKPVNHLNLDPEQQKSFVLFYKSLPEKPLTTVRFFNRQDYYTVHGQDAVFAAKDFYKTNHLIKIIGSDGDTLESLIFNKANFEAYIKQLLLINHYRVEIFINKGGKWTIEFKGSPGNLTQFEDLLFANVEQIEANTVIALKLGPDFRNNKIVGLGAVDSVERKFQLSEFTDDEYFSHTESMVIKVSPKECVLMIDGSNPDFEQLKKVVERCGVLVTSRKKVDFSTDSLVQDLNQLILFEEGQQLNAHTLPQLHLETACGALAAAIKYLELSSDSDNLNQFTVENLNYDKFVHLDSAGVEALNLIPTPGTISKNDSILGILDKCRTPHGHRLLTQWIKQPLRDLNKINERLDIVESLINDTDVRQQLHDQHLRLIPDLQALMRKIQRKKANLQDCYRIYHAVQKLPSLVETLNNSDHKTLNSVIVMPLKELVNDMCNYQSMIEETIDFTLVERGDFLIQSGFDEELQEMRNQMDELEKKMKSNLTKTSETLQIQVKLDSNSQYGFFFKASLKDGKTVSNNKSYEVLDTTKGGGMRFRSSKLTELNNDYQTIHQKYVEHQKSIVEEVIKTASSYNGTLINLSRTLAHLDVLTSFAMLAASSLRPYVRPVLNPQGTGLLDLKQVRHPCVELQDSVSFIPNDAYFKQGECTFNVITGPNMGGKSTYIRSVATAVFMAHLGSFVPCDSAEISVVDAILARVGANDSQIKGLSTFMVEMIETVSILKKATVESLVIIDELGRGTSTYEGCGIACAIAERLATETKAFTLFATHFHELTKLSETIPSIINKHVTAVTSENNLTLLYQVQQGSCDKSFGIHVAIMAKFPENVIQDASKKLSLLESFQNQSNSENKQNELNEADKEKFLNECKRYAKEQTSSDQDLFNQIKRLRTEFL
ncbi:DNA mismatch repair protein Msh2 [Daktulosphaira vitifoliae]|uniref:DNA mismatch repair protein Msh2 n=1 Tax=Daktulosphaira vitifoliae TaxID=58002 RepID=UPI0021AA5260|nr:DNA mismatch repair protein Msh2 [Daktulosphaira vitifoliae]